ncbi:interferon-induced protein 44-like isoform X1 [Haliotis rufescens]|uniref:interferon-induced protein 44-like isoform X1 n=1 Tax=Haliotis rufescens TaxID=6454 RepID=UPI00201EA232|nr:interferon-induced protein 44-like isoform X1 [Haliotis rufescens]
MRGNCERWLTDIVRLFKMPCWDKCVGACGVCLLMTIAHLCACCLPRRIGGKKKSADRSFDKSLRNGLFKRILSWTPYNDNTNTTTLKILVIGPEDSGKSAFINSLVSIFLGKIIHLDDMEQCLEKRLTHGRKALPIVMCECKETSEEDSLYDQVLRAIEAQTPAGENVSTNTMTIMTEEVAPDTSLGVIFVVDVQKIAGLMQTDLVAKYDSIADLLKHFDVPRCVVLTHADILEPDVRAVFGNGAVKTALLQAQMMFDLPEHDVFPVKCYTDEQQLHQNMDILLLNALDSILEILDRNNVT